MRAFSHFQCKVHMLYILDLFICVPMLLSISVNPGPTTRSDSAFQRNDSFLDDATSLSALQIVQ
jgi:hypothetical protein